MDNTGFSPVVNNLSNVVNYGNITVIGSLKLKNMIPFQIRSYYRYSGSLTTPECDEIVDWFVIESPVLAISAEQMIGLQSLKNEDDDLVKLFFFFKLFHIY
jgi:carbonic anhydrase